MSKLKKKFCFSKNFESHSISVRQSFVKITRMVFESFGKNKILPSTWISCMFEIEPLQTYNHEVFVL